MLAAFVHGFILAMALILPLGPQNSFILTQGTRYRIKHVLPTIVTAAASDTFLIVLSVSGVSVLVSHFPVLRLVFTLGGSVFLLWMGFKSWRHVPSETADAAPMSTGRQIRQSLSVSLLNPHAIFDTFVIIGGGASLYGISDERWAYAMAAISVSWIWFVVLAAAGRLIWRWGGRKVLKVLNRGSAVLMWAIALKTLWSN